MSTIDIKVPDIGDFKEVAIIELLVKPGDTVMLEGVGGGFTWGAALLKY